MMVGRSPSLPKHAASANGNSRTDAKLAARFARDGDAEQIAFEETDTSFKIAWPGSYRLDGLAFVYIDRHTRRISTILGYPTHLIARH